MTKGREPVWIHNWSGPSLVLLAHLGQPDLSRLLPFVPGLSRRLPTFPKSRFFNTCPAQYCEATVEHVENHEETKEEKKKEDKVSSGNEHLHVRVIPLFICSRFLSLAAVFFLFTPKNSTHNPAANLLLDSQYSPKSSVFHYCFSIAISEQSSR